MEEAVEREHIIKKHVQKAAERAAKEAAVRTTVELCQEFGLSFSGTIRKVMTLCGYDQESATQEVAQYWVC